MGCSSSVSTQESMSSSDSRGTITVYGMLMSPATQRVLATLAEKNLKFEMKIVDLTTGENQTPLYLEKNPFGVIPTLVDTDGSTICESRAICRYLELKYRGKGTELIPKKNAKIEGLFEQAVSIESSYFDSFASAMTNELIFKKMRGGEPDMSKVADLRLDLGKKLDIYEKILSKQPYLGGETYTLADLFHLPLGSLLIMAGEQELFESRSRPHVKQWWNKISTRPAWKSVQAMK